MKILRVLIRTLGILLGSLLVLAVIGDALGMAPASGTTGSLGHRLATLGPVVFAAMLLLLPYGRLGARVQALGALGLGAFALVLAFLAWRSVQGVQAGSLPWAAIPASLVILAIVAANALVLGMARRPAPVAATVGG